MGIGEEAVTCRECGDTYTLRDGCDPSDYCDPCAQGVVLSLRASLAASEAAKEAAEVDLDAIEKERDEAQDGWYRLRQEVNLPGGLKDQLAASEAALRHAQAELGIEKLNRKEERAAAESSLAEARVLNPAAISAPALAVVAEELTASLAEERRGRERAEARAATLEEVLDDLLPLVEDNGEFRKMKVTEIARRVAAARRALTPGAAQTTSSEEGA
jgi:hypothetical protein